MSAIMLITGWAHLFCSVFLPILRSTSWRMAFSVILEEVEPTR